MTEIKPDFITSSYKCQLPVAVHTIKVPDNCTWLIIQMIGGGGSALLKNGTCVTGQSGAGLEARFDAPNKNDKIEIVLGLGGNYQIIDNVDTTFVDKNFQIVDKDSACDGKRGGDSVLKVNDEIIAIAKGSSDTIETFENKYATFINVDPESSFKHVNKRPLLALTLNDLNGEGGWGGRGKVFENGVYLGAGGHGAAMVWIRHFYYWCNKCYKHCMTTEEFKQHEYEHLV
jgi:hypothetical protein